MVTIPDPTSCICRCATNDMEIRLLPWRAELREELAAMCSRVDRRYLSDRLPHPYSAEDADFWFRKVAEHEGKDAVYRAIYVNDHLAGSISLEQSADVYRKNAEIGYFLLDEYGSCGVMSAAVGMACELAFQTLDILRITAFVFAENTASVRVLQKNGFQLEGHLRDAAWKNGSAFDVFIFGKMKEN